MELNNSPVSQSRIYLISIQRGTHLEVVCYMILTAISLNADKPMEKNKLDHMIIDLKTNKLNLT